MIPNPLQPAIPYHDTLDISQIEMVDGAGPRVVFVTVPPFKRTMQYKLAGVVVSNTLETWETLELCVSKPKEDVSQYQGYVTIKKSIEPLIAFLDRTKQDQADKNPLLILRFFTSDTKNEEAVIAFWITKRFVDVFDEHRLYFTADGNSIKARDRLFKNGSAREGTQNH